MELEDGSDCEEVIQDEAMISEYLFDDRKYQIEFHLERTDFRQILEEIVVKSKLKFSCIAGGYFTKFNGQTTTPDIYIISGSNYNLSENYLNEFLNENFRKFKFEQLGTVAPQAVMATKNVIMKNGKSARIFFTYVNFPKSDNHKIQLLNTYDLEPCKIMYSYGNNRYFCSKWFSKGGCIIYDNRTPSYEFLQKYYQKGFVFEKDIFDAGKSNEIDLNRVY